jgi:ABC-type branched-subunit amino acid transport system ATPase component
VIEENPFEVLQYVDRVYLLQAGVFEREMPAKDLLEDESLRELFFGTDADADSPAEDQPAPA